MNRVKSILLAAAILCGCALQSSAQEVIVNVRPERPRYERIVAPSRRHVWIEEEWEPRRGRYEFAGGRWALPPRYGMAWVPGHWVRRPRGWFWVRGRWRR